MKVIYFVPIVEIVLIWSSILKEYTLKIFNVTNDD